MLRNNRDGDKRNDSIHNTMNVYVVITMDCAIPYERKKQFLLGAYCMTVYGYWCYADWCRSESTYMWMYLMLYLLRQNNGSTINVCNAYML